MWLLLIKWLSSLEKNIINIYVQFNSMAPFTFWHGLTLIPASMENYWCTVSCLRWNYLSIPNFSLEMDALFNITIFGNVSIIHVWIEVNPSFQKGPHVVISHIFVVLFYYLSAISAFSKSNIKNNINPLWTELFCRKSFLDIDIAQVVEPVPHRRHRLSNRCLPFICHVYISLILKQLIYQAHI